MVEIHPCQFVSGCIFVGKKSEDRFIIGHQLILCFKIVYYFFKGKLVVAPFQAFKTLEQGCEIKIVKSVDWVTTLLN
jgi:hypothetical protein